VNPLYASVLVKRTAGIEAAFFVPFLDRGSRVLDVGCGHGTITVGLAETVAPGQVVGIDLDAGRIEAAKALASDRGIDNLEFRVGDLTSLPFPAESFDAVFEHTVFMYLSDPLRAAREMHRVLRAGGVFGMRDTDFRASVWGSSNPLMQRVPHLIQAWFAQRGTDLVFGRSLRGILHDAGFVRIEATASCDNHGTPELLSAFGDVLERNLRQPDMVQFATTAGLVDEGQLEQICAAVQSWCADPHSFHTGVMGEAIGWKG
jgi:SAM-dependent methyltransferase